MIWTRRAFLTTVGGVLVLAPTPFAVTVTDARPPTAWLSRLHVQCGDRASVLRLHRPNGASVLTCALSGGGTFHWWAAPGDEIALPLVNASTGLGDQRETDLTIRAAVYQVEGRHYVWTPDGVIVPLDAGGAPVPPSPWVTP